MQSRGICTNCTYLRRRENATHMYCVFIICSLHVLCVFVITSIFYVYTQSRVYSMHILSHVIHTWYLHAYSVHMRWCLCIYSYVYTCTLPDTHIRTHIYILSLSLPLSLSFSPPPLLYTHTNTHSHTYTHTYTRTRTQVLNWGRRLHAAWRVRDKVVRWVRRTLLSSALVVISICIYAQICRLHAVRRFRAICATHSCFALIVVSVYFERANVHMHIIHIHTCKFIYIYMCVCTIHPYTKKKNLDLATHRTNPHILLSDVYVYVFVYIHSCICVYIYIYMIYVNMYTCTYI